MQARAETQLAMNFSDVAQVPDINSVICVMRESRRKRRKVIATSTQLIIDLEFKQDSDTAVEWNEESIADLRFEILVDALSKLCDNRVSKSMQNEAIDWLHSNEEAPFSFVVCCQSEGLRHSELRDLALFHHKKYQKA